MHLLFYYSTSPLKTQLEMERRQSLLSRSCGCITFKKDTNIWRLCLNPFDESGVILLRVGSPKLFYISEPDHLSCLVFLSVYSPWLISGFCVVMEHKRVWKQATQLPDWIQHSACSSTLWLCRLAILSVERKERQLHFEKKYGTE